ncbi:MAG: DUF721 domain-containing protein [Ignavibacteriae bacterium]|nr:DUF721 domain-containing protein [Ignavibacteriota bacterium]
MVAGYNKSAQPLKEVFESLISGFGWDELVKQEKVPELWKEIVGEKIAGKVSYVRFENRILFIRLDSSVWKAELFLRKENFKNEINNRYGSKIVDEIVIR